MILPVFDLALAKSLTTMLASLMMANWLISDKMPVVPTAARAASLTSSEVVAN